MLPELAVSNAFTDRSFWNKSSFPHRTDPLELHNVMALSRCYCAIRLALGTEAVVPAAAVGPRSVCLLHERLSTGNQCVQQVL